MFAFRKTIISATYDSYTLFYLEYETEENYSKYASYNNFSPNCPTR